MTFIISVSVGFLFGFALQKAGLGHYDRIINQFRFRDNFMMQFMLSSISVGGVIYFAFTDVGFAARLQTAYLHNTYIFGNLLGGAIFGVGMAIAGTCPGTILAGIGQGNLDYLCAGLLGFIAGALIYGINFPFFLSLTQIGFYG
ncbi:MAG: YeeE/YedE family protein, partial [Deferribacteraceae bacterium]|nr:YeeE/YedE family protein [Deferribacteraceae bacterium]